MSVDTTKFKLIPLSGAGRIGEQGRVFELGTEDALTTATATGYIDNLVDLKVPYKNRSVFPGDQIKLNYLTNDVAGSQWANTIVRYDEVNDTYTLEVISEVPPTITATDVAFTPSGNITAMEVQSAVQELDGLKASVSDPILFGTTTVEDLSLLAGGDPSAIAGTAVLVAGTVTVPSDRIEAGSIVLLTHKDPGTSTAIGTLSVGTITANTSFVINSLASTAVVETGDVSVVSWVIIKPYNAGP